MVENIFHQKRWKIFSAKIAGKYFPVENVFHRADEFSLSKTFYKSTNQFSVLCVTALLIGHQKNLWFYATIKSANDVQY